MCSHRLPSSEEECNLDVGTEMDPLTTDIPTITFSHSDSNIDDGESTDEEQEEETSDEYEEEEHEHMFINSELQYNTLLY